MAGPAGAKRRDYWWTVIAVDPIAIPVTRLLARNRRFTPDAVTWISLILGLSVGVAFALGTRWSLIVGGVLFYVSFMFDCVDGKLARELGVSSARGQRLDEIADGARRLSAALGLTFGLWRIDTDVLHLTPLESFLGAAGFGLLAAYFMEIAQGTSKSSEPRGEWEERLARRRLLPTPGMPDVSAIVYVIGPITGLVGPALMVGAALIVVGILRLWFNLSKG